MKTRLQASPLMLLPQEADTAHSEGRLIDGLLPVAILMVVAVVRLAAFAWQPVSWGAEESIALAFALGSGFLLTQYLPRKNRNLSGSRS